MIPPSRRAVRGGLAIALLAGCGGPAVAPATGPGADSLPPFAALRDVERSGAFAHRDVVESSAAVRSPSFPGVFWTLNDSGNDARLFAFDAGGLDLGAVRLTGVTNRDWEAMAAGPCPEGRCLYVADIGDNLARHPSVVVWRVAEPEPPGADRASAATPSARLELRYPDGPRDAEAIWVDADTTLWIASKRPERGADGRARPTLVFRAAASAWRDPAAVAVLALVDSLPNVPGSARRTLVTDAALADPFGTDTAPPLLAVRTYEQLLLFRVERRVGRPLALAARCLLTPLDEAQGEGVSWRADGRLLLTSEGRFAPLHTARCP